MLVAELYKDATGLFLNSALSSSAAPRSVAANAISKAGEDTL